MKVVVSNFLELLEVSGYLVVFCYVLFLLNRGLER